MVTGILRQTVLDKQGDTQEQELHIQIKKQISGGWNMIYKDKLYDFIEELTKAEFRLYRFLEKMILSRAGKDVHIVGVEIARNEVVAIKTQEETRFENIEEVPSPTNDTKAISKMLTFMVKNNIIMETEPKYYRYNPYIVLPPFSDAEYLQKEWNNLRKIKSFKRRGRDILDEFYDHKHKTKQWKLKFEDWIKDIDDIEIKPEIIYSIKKESK